MKSKNTKIPDEAHIQPATIQVATLLLVQWLVEQNAPQPFETDFAANRPTIAAKSQTTAVDKG